MDLVLDYNSPHALIRGDLRDAARAPGLEAGAEADVTQPPPSGAGSDHPQAPPVAPWPGDALVLVTHLYNVSSDSGLPRHTPASDWCLCPWHWGQWRLTPGPHPDEAGTCQTRRWAWATVRLLLHLLTHSLFPTELTFLSTPLQDSRATSKIY